MLSRRLAWVMVNDENRVADIGRPPYRCREVIGVVQSVEETKKREPLTPEISSKVLHTNYRDVLDLASELPARVTELNTTEIPSSQSRVCDNESLLTPESHSASRQPRVSQARNWKRLKSIGDRM
jgi:hypothetical protein